MANKIILLSTFGTQGDILPMVRLATVLKQHGFHPRMMVNPSVASQLEAVGVQPVVIRESIDINLLLTQNPRFMGHRGGGYVLRDIFIPLAETVYRKTRELILNLNPAAIVSHAGSFGMTWAAWSWHVPSAIVHLAPTTLFSASAFRGLPGWKRLSYRMILPIFARNASGWMRPVCQQIGITWHKRIFYDSFLKADRVLALWSPLMHSTIKDDPSQLVICGFTQPGSKAQVIEPRVERFLQAGSPPVVFSLGASAVNLPTDFYHDAITACRLLKVRGLFLTGPKQIDCRNRDLISVPDASHAALFPRCRAVVHHGGIGTSAECLRAGVPCVVIPHAHDQFDNANRLAALGISLTLYRHHVNAGNLACSIKKLANEIDPKRSLRIHHLLAEEQDGAQVAAAQIASLI